MKRALRMHLGDFLAILALVLLGAGTAAYILSNQRLRFPLVEEEPFRLKVELPDAQAVTPGQGQTIRIAGVEVGQIGRVTLEDGRALVSLDIETKYEGLIKRDATALLRSKTGVKDMFLEVDPGEGRPLRRGGTIRVENTAPDIDPDEFLSALDADTRDYLRLLISGAGKGLRGRGSDLRETLARFGPLHRDLARLTRSVARRRGNLRRLVHNYGHLVRELGSKDQELTRLVGRSNEVFESFAAEDLNISTAVARLPGTLRQTERTLLKADPFARRLGPTLETLRPAVRRLNEANAEALPLLREGEPILRRRVRPFVRIATPYLRQLGEGAEDLSRAGPDLTTAFGKLNRLFNILAHNPNGAEGLTGNMGRDRARQEGYLYWLAWGGQAGTSLFSTADAQGVWRRFTLCNVDPTTLASQIVPALSQLPPATQQQVLTTLANAGIGGACR
jgi:phospholipid/cholesterol/gamma-HCH transport system substrate-binding protein